MNAWSPTWKIISMQASGIVHATRTGVRSCAEELSVLAISTVRKLEWMTRMRTKITNTPSASFSIRRARGDRRRDSRSIDRCLAWWLANAAPNIASAYVPPRTTSSLIARW